MLFQHNETSHELLRRVTLEEFLVMRRVREPGVLGELDWAIEVEQVWLPYGAWSQVERDIAGEASH